MSRPSSGSLAWWKQRFGFAEGAVWEAFVADFRHWHREPAVPRRRYTKIASPTSQLGLWSVLRHEWGPKYWGAAAQGLLPGAERWPADEDGLRRKLVAFNNIERIKNETNRRKQQMKAEETAEAPRRFHPRVKKAKIEFIFHLQNSITHILPFLRATHAPAFEALTLRLCEEAGMAEREVENVVRVAYRLEESDDLVELKLGRKIGNESWDILMRAVEGKDVWQGELIGPFVLHIDIFVD